MRRNDFDTGGVVNRVKEMDQDVSEGGFVATLLKTSGELLPYFIGIVAVVVFVLGRS